MQLTPCCTKWCASRAGPALRSLQLVQYGLRDGDRVRMKTTKRKYTAPVTAYITTGMPPCMVTSGDQYIRGLEVLSAAEHMLIYRLQGTGKVLQSLKTPRQFSCCFIFYPGLVAQTSPLRVSLLLCSEYNPTVYSVCLAIGSLESFILTWSMCNLYRGNYHRPIHTDAAKSPENMLLTLFDWLDIRYSR